MNKKRKYERPRTTVVELQHRTMLLAGSEVSANRNSYGTATEDTWN